MKDYRLKDVFTLEDDALMHAVCQIRLGHIFGLTLPWLSQTCEELHFCNATYFRTATLFYQFLQSHGDQLATCHIQKYASAAVILAKYAEEEDDIYNNWLTESYSNLSNDIYNPHEIALAEIDLLQKLDYRLHRFETLYDTYIAILFAKLNPKEHKRMAGQLSLVTFCHQHTRFDHELLLGLLSLILFQDDHGILKSYHGVSSKEVRQCAYFLMDIVRTFPSSHAHFSDDYHEDKHKYVGEEPDKIHAFCKDLKLRGQDETPYALPMKLKLYLRRLRYTERKQVRLASNILSLNRYATNYASYLHGATKTSNAVLSDEGENEAIHGNQIVANKIPDEQGPIRMLSRHSYWLISSKKQRYYHEDAEVGVMNLLTHRVASKA